MKSSWFKPRCDLSGISLKSRWSHDLMRPRGEVTWCLLFTKDASRNCGKWPKCVIESWFSKVTATAFRAPRNSLYNKAMVKMTQCFQWAIKQFQDRSSPIYWWYWKIYFCIEYVFKWMLRWEHFELFFSLSQQQIWR